MHKLNKPQPISVGIGLTE
ncbi:unnamed protein product, partial [Rotaria socialis]